MFGWRKIECQLRSIWNNFWLVWFPGAYMRKCPPLVLFSVDDIRECPPEFSWWGKQENVLFHIFARAYIKHKNTSILCLRGNKKIPPFDFKSVHKKVPPTPWDFNWRKTKWYTTHWIFTVCTQKMSPQWNFDGCDTKRCPPRGIFTSPPWDFYGKNTKNVPLVGFWRGGKRPPRDSLGCVSLW